MVLHRVQTWAHDLCTIGYLWDSINHNGWTCFVSQYAYFLSIVIFFILLWLRHCIGNKDYLTSEGHCWNTVLLFCIYWLRITNRSLANTRILIIAKKKNRIFIIFISNGHSKLRNSINSTIQHQRRTYISNPKIGEMA